MSLKIKKKFFVLGTAQLGSNYGITNSKQKVSKKESFKILDLAWEKELDILIQLQHIIAKKLSVNILR